MMFANDIDVSDISAVYLTLFYHIMPHYAAAQLFWIISFHIIITARRLLRLFMKAIMKS